MKILTSEAMARLDRRASVHFAVPSILLMENAAIAVVDALGERFPAAQEVAILCGPGNNGGDGLAILRHLVTRGYRAWAAHLTGGRVVQGDPRLQLDICRNFGLELFEVTSGEGLAEALERAREADCLVDALFGTGLGRPLEGLFAEAVRGINALGRPVVAVDLPSGLDASRGEIPGPHVVADLTVTFATLKLAHVFPPASEAAGEVAVADLGVPGSLVEESAGSLYLLEPQDVAAAFPPRRPDAHKGSHGHALLVAGGPGRAGAAVLAARAAVRSGAGLVTVATPAAVRNPVDLGSLESMTLGLACDARGELVAEAAEAILEAAAGKTALALGPGLGRLPGAEEAIRRVVLGCPLPLVLDADGLNAFEGRIEELASRPGPTVLTPHPGEMARLLGCSSAEVQADRLAAAGRAAELASAVVVLKGQLSLIAEPGGRIWVNPTGNPGMASGGMGDVLTGMIAALLAQGREPALAASGAVYVHGAAGDAASKRRRAQALAASDLLEELPGAIAATAEP